MARNVLIDRVFGTSEHVLIQAGTGYGKTLLLDQVCARAGDQAVRFNQRPGPNGAPHRFAMRLRAAYERAGAFDLAADLVGGGDQPLPSDYKRAATIVVIDDLERLDEAAARLLADHVGRTHGLVRLVGGGRSIPTALKRLELGHPVLQLSADDLSATPVELHQLLTDHLPQIVVPTALLTQAIDSCAGCFAVLHALVRRVASSSEPRLALGRLIERNTLLPALVQQCADDLDPTDVSLLRSLAAVTSFTTDLADAIGGRGSMDRLLAAGVPIRVDESGWLSLPRPVAELLAANTPLSDDLTDRVTTALVDARRLGEALDLLLRSHRLERAAEVLSLAGPSTPAGMTSVDLLCVIDQLGAAAAGHPIVFLQRAHAFWDLAMPNECRGALAEAEDRAARMDDGVVRRQAAAELALLTVLDGPTPEGTEVIEKLEAEIGPDEVATLARLTEARGAISAWRHDQHSLAAAELLYRRTAALWAQVGNDAMRSRALRGLAVAVLLPAGRYDTALRELRAALALSSRGGVEARTASLVLLAQVAAINGDVAVAEPVLAEARLLARTAGVTWVEAYAAWADMTLASLRGDAAAVRRYHGEAVDLLGALADQTTGTILCVDATIAAARAGDDDYGRMQLVDLESRPGTSGDRELARLVVDAYAGDAHDAVDLARSIEAEHRLPPARRWQVSLMHALALARADRPTDAEQIYTAALRQAGDWGVGHLPGSADARACRYLDRALACDDDIAHLPGAEQFAVRSLGAFEVWRNGRLLPMGTSNATELIKLVAASGGRASVDAVCDALWPETTTEAGRKRLKNVILRARVATGGLVERADQLVVFRPGTTLDVNEFDQQYRQAQRAFRSDAPEGRHLARGALAVAGTLLPDDLYAEWAIDARAQTNRRIASLIDIVLSEGVDVAGATWLAELVTSADPYDDGRLLRIAAVLNENGGEALASALINQVGEMLDELHLGA